MSACKVEPESFSCIKVEQIGHKLSLTREARVAGNALIWCITILTPIPKCVKLFLKNYFISHAVSDNLPSINSLPKGYNIQDLGTGSQQLRWSPSVDRRGQGLGHLLLLFQFMSRKLNPKWCNWDWNQYPYRMFL